MKNTSTTISKNNKLLLRVFCLLAAVAFLAILAFNLPQIQKFIVYATNGETPTENVDGGGQSETAAEDSSLTADEELGDAEANAADIYLYKNDGTSGYSKKSASGNSFSGYYFTSDIAKSALPSREGYSFLGYYTTQGDTSGMQVISADGQNKSGSSNKFTVNKLYAQWQLDRKTITINEAPQKYFEDGTTKSFEVKVTTGPSDGYTLTYSQGGEAVTNPKEPGSYNVNVYRAEDTSWAELNVDITDGLVILDCPIDVSVQKFLYDTTAKSFAINLTGTTTWEADSYSIDYYQGSTKVDNPTNVGLYNVKVHHDADADYPVFDKTITKGLQIIDTYIDESPQKFLYDETTKSFNVKPIDESYPQTDYTVTYSKDGVAVENPQDTGAYDVRVQHAAEGKWAALDRTITGGLQIISTYLNETPQTYYYDNHVKAFIPKIIEEGAPADGYSIEYYQDSTKIESPQNVGTYDVKIHHDATDEWNELNRTIEGGLIIIDSIVDHTPQKYYYDGAAKSFDIKITDPAAPASDYSLRYYDGANQVYQPIDAGTYDVIVHHEATSDWPVLDIIISGGLIILDAPIDESQQVYEFDGAEHKFEITPVSGKGPESGYLVEYYQESRKVESPTNAGLYDVRVLHVAEGTWPECDIVITGGLAIQPTDVNYSWQKRDGAMYCSATYQDVGLSKVVAEEVKAEAEKTIVETEDNDGEITYHATFTNALFLEQTYTEVVTALGAHQDHDNITFIQWNPVDYLPTEDLDTDQGYYLTGDVTITSTTSISATLHLCLNGHSIINTSESSAFSVSSGAYLYLYDCRSGYEYKRHYFELDSSSTRWVPTDETSERYIDGGYIASTSTSINTSTITNNGNLTLSGVSVVGGKSTSGGALVTGASSVTNIISGGFYGNTAAYGGGAIRNTADCVIHISGATFKENCTVGSSIETLGGAISCETTSATLDIENTVFQGNYVSSNSGLARCRGGAIYLAASNNKTLVTNINNCNFFNNYAQVGSSASGGQPIGGAICVDRSFPTISNTSIHDNYVKAPIEGIQMWGGGVVASADFGAYSIISLNGKVDIYNNKRVTVDSTNGKEDNLAYEQCGGTSSRPTIVNALIQLQEGFDSSSVIGFNMWNWESSILKHSNGRITEGYYNNYKVTDPIPSLKVDNVLEGTWCILQAKEKEGENRELYISQHIHDFDYKLSGVEGLCPRNIEALCPEGKVDHDCQYVINPLVVSLEGATSKYDGASHPVKPKNLEELEMCTDSTEVGNIRYYKKNNSVSGGWEPLNDGVEPVEKGTYKAELTINCKNKSSEVYNEEGTNLTIVSNEYSITNDIFVTFNANGGSWTESANPDTVSRVESVGANFALPDSPTASDPLNYSFAGWYNNIACTGDRIDENTIVEQSHDNKTFYAKWNQIISITGQVGTKYSGTAGTIKSTEGLDSSPSGIGYEVSSNKIIFDGKESICIEATAGANSIFDFWSTDVEGNNPVSVTGTVDATTIFYAQFAPTITINATVTNGSITESNSLPYVLKSGLKWKHTTVNDYKIELIEQGENARERTITLVPDNNYHLDKWQVNGTDITGDQEGSLTINSTFTAVLASGYSITLDKNGGSGGLTNIATTGTTLPSLVGNLPTSDDGIFQGYYDSTNWTSAKQYYDKNGNALTTWDKSANGKLYAKWEEKQTVSIDDSQQKVAYSNKATSFNIVPEDGSPTDIDSYTVEYWSGDTKLSEPPSALGSYKVVVSRASDSTYKSFSQTLNDGLVIEALDVSSGYTIGAFEEMTYDGTEKTPSATVTKNGLTVTGQWSKVVNVSDKTTFVADGNFKGSIRDKSTGMLQAEPAINVDATATYTVPTEVEFDTGYDGDGVLSSTSSDSTKATVSIVDGTKVKVTPIDSGEVQITVSASEGDNYKAATKTQTATINPGTITVTENKATGLTYTGSALDLGSITTTPTDCTIEYKVDEATSYSSDLPKATNAGSHTVNYKATKTGYSDKTGSFTVSIARKNATLAPSAITGTYTVPTAGTFTYNYDGDGAVTVSSGTESVATASVNTSTKTVTVTPLTAGSATITISAAQGTNYNATSATHTATVSAGEITVTENPASGLTYTGSDLELGSITTNPTDCTIEYKVDDATSYSSESPKATNAGSHTVNYKATKTGYTDKTGSFTVSIARKNATLSPSVTTGSYTVPTAGTFTYNYDGDGGVTVSSDTESVATASVNTSTKTVTVTPLTAGSATITINAAQGTNYNATSATHTATVSAGEITVTENPASGLTYTGSALELGSITTNPTDCTIEYKVDDATSYSSDLPKATNAGSHTVYYKATKTGYTDKTGSFTVSIARKNATLSPSVTTGSYTVPTAGTFTYNYDGDGGVTVSSDTESVATASVNTSTKTVTVTPLTAGSATITISAAQGTNYNATSATHTATVSAGTINYTATPASGLTYDGSAKTLGTVSVSSPEGCSISYTVDGTIVTEPKAITAGEHTVAFAITKTGYTTVDSSFKATIAKAKANVPTAVTGLVYNGDVQTGVKLPSDAKYTLTDNTGKNAKTDYQATASLTDKVNYEWNLGTPTSDDQKITWSIAKKAINVKAENKTSKVGHALLELTYIADSLFGEDKYTGALSTDANKDVKGDYDITQGTLTAGDNYSITFTAGKYHVVDKEVQTIVFDKVPQGGVLNKTYGDGSFTETVTGAKTTVTYSSDNTTVAEVDSNSGEVTIKKAGTATITATAEETTEYAQATASYILNVAKAQIDVPKAETGLVFNNDVQTGVKLPTDAKYTLTGNTGKDAKNYVATAALSDKENYEWKLSPVTANDQEIEWSIAKLDVADGTVGQFAKMTYTGSVQTPQATVTKNGLEATGTWSDVTIVADKTTFTAIGNFTGSIENVETGMLRKQATITVDPASATYSFPTAGQFSYTYDGDGPISATSQTASVATAVLDSVNKKVTVTPLAGGTSNIVVSSADGANYLAAQATHVATVDAGEIIVQTHPAQNLTYNNQEQGLGNVTAQPSGCTIEYKVDGGAYSSTLPTGKDAKSYKVDYKVSKDGYATVEDSFDVTIAKLDIADGTVGQFAKMTYTGSAQTPQATVTKNGLEATGAWSEVTNVADKTTFTASGNFTGSIEDVSPGMLRKQATITVDPVSASYNIPTPGTFKYTYDGDSTVSVESEPPNIASASLDSAKHQVTVTPLADGTSNIVVSATQGANYSAAQATHVATVGTKLIVVTPHPAKDLKYNGDDQELGYITTDVEDCNILYKVNDGEYSKNVPKAKNAGKYVVGYKASKDGYPTAESTFEVTIAKKQATLNLYPTKATYNMDNPGKFTYDYDGDGALSVASSQSTIATASIDTASKEVTIKPAAVGSTDIVVTATDGDNYLTVSATHFATIAKGVIVVTPHPTTGLVYNESAQPLGNVSTSVTGCTIEYKVNEGTYSASEPTGKNAGKYTVYYRVTKAGYDEVTGNFSTTIAKAPNPSPLGPSPSQVVVVSETFSKKGDGKITGVDSTMEYRHVNTPATRFAAMNLVANQVADEGWIAVPVGTTELTNLVAGTYEVRYKGDENHEPSLILTTTLNQGPKIVASFDANGHGAAPEKQLLDYNSKVFAPADLTCDGYTFGGWYKDKECSKDKKWNFDSDTVTADTTLYAKWTADDVPDVPVNPVNPDNNDSASAVSQTADYTFAFILTVLFAAGLAFVCLWKVTKRK